MLTRGRSSKKIKLQYIWRRFNKIELKKIKKKKNAILQGDSLQLIPQF